MFRRHTKDLLGAELDAAVALAERRGLSLSLTGEQQQCFVDGILFAPSTNWADGGPIIDRERMNFATVGTGPRDAAGHLPIIAICLNSRIAAEGPTHLIAAMRAFVADRLGESVELG